MSKNPEHRGATPASNVKASDLKRASVNSKAARQASFKAACAGMSAKEVVAEARLIPDADPSNFKVLRVCG